MKLSDKIGDEIIAAGDGMGKNAVPERRPEMSPHPVLNESEVAAAFRFAFHAEPRPIDLAWHRRYWSFDQLRAAFLGAPAFWQINKHLINPDLKEFAVELANGMTAWIDSRDLYVGPGMMKGDWEQAEIAFMQSHLNAGDCMLDIGAMLGWFTLHAAQAVGPGGVVVAFEPQPHIHALLRKSILANRLEGWVQTHEIALSDHPGWAHLMSEPMTVVDAASNRGHVWIESSLRNPTPSDGPVCRLARLDDMVFARKIDFVKIDVEGAELLALRGAERHLRSSRPVILAEMYPEQLAAVSKCRPDDLIALMIAWGYGIDTLMPDGTLRPWTASDADGAMGRPYCSVVFR